MAATRKPRSPSTAGGADHHRFLRPGALARLRDARLRRGSRTSRMPPPSSPPSPPPPPPGAGDGEGGTVMPYFVPVSRLLAPRCPQRKKLTAAKSVVIFSPPPPPSLDLPVEAVIEFLNSPDMVVAAH
ncbi:protein STRUBBELIG-RECEPTOR FAMILY 3 [Phragmites australis]|uniref:protein STRUBBELIG-RECEPTOR FAMILY 3 n=1 Tax=Phragmites australis TaxID=29695 RepID=UPI002D78DF27|nr:protein STRUBBELIG-RECEPTOR FAMILY 3 [Phragmites australis]